MQKKRKSKGKEERKLTKYSDLPEAKSALIADKEIIQTLFRSGYEYLILNLYDEVYTTPEIYDYFAKNLDLDSLKIFRSEIKRAELKTSKIVLRSIIGNDEILSEDEAYAILYAMTNKIDVILDDPRKYEMFKVRNIHTLRLSEIIAAAKNSD